MPYVYPDTLDMARYFYFAVVEGLPTQDFARPLITNDWRIITSETYRPNVELLILSVSVLPKRLGG